MKFKPQVLFSLVILIFLIVFVYEAKDWRMQARLYPWAIGFPMIVLALVHIYNELSGKVNKPKESTAVATPTDYQFTQGIDKNLARRRTINIFCWIFAFYVGIWLIGFSYMVPLFVFVYLKVQSGEGWGLSIGLTAGAWLIFWGLFTRLLSLPFPDGKIQVWLGLS